MFSVKNISSNPLLNKSVKQTTVELFRELKNLSTYSKFLRNKKQSLKENPKKNK